MTSPQDMVMRDIIERKLRAYFSPTQLEVLDESALHDGHSGARAGGQTHFRVIICAKAFDGVSPLERHRAIMEVLADEFDSDNPHALHALAISATTP